MGVGTKEIRVKDASGIHRVIYVAKFEEAIYVRQCFQKIIRLIKPEGTYLLWLDCRALGMSEAQLKHFFVHEADVGTSPGVLFGEGGSGFMRMNIAAPHHTIVAALENIRKAERDAGR